MNGKCIPNDSFVVLLLHRDDIYEAYQDTTVEFDDADMKYIAEKVGSILTEHDFWEALEVVVNDFIYVRTQRGE
jgi:hypothetical protein